MPPSPSPPGHALVPLTFTFRQPVQDKLKLPAPLQNCIDLVSGLLQAVFVVRWTIIQTGLGRTIEIPLLRRKMLMDKGKIEFFFPYKPIMSTTTAI